MNIDDMRLRFEADIDSFVSHWKTMSDLEPTNYPAEMDEQEWYEQFLAYLPVWGGIEQ